MKNVNTLLELSRAVCDHFNILSIQLYADSKQSIAARKLFIYIAVKKYDFPLSFACGYVKMKTIDATQYIKEVARHVDLRSGDNFPHYVEIMKKALPLEGSHKGNF